MIVLGSAQRAIGGASMITSSGMEESTDAGGMAWAARSWHGDVTGDQSWGGRVVHILVGGGVVRSGGTGWQHGTWLQAWHRIAARVLHDGTGTGSCTAWVAPRGWAAWHHGGHGHGQRQWDLEEMGGGMAWWWFDGGWRHLTWMAQSRGGVQHGQYMIGWERTSHRRQGAWVWWIGDGENTGWWGSRAKPWEVMGTEVDGGWGAVGMGSLALKERRARMGGSDGGRQLDKGGIGWDGLLVVRASDGGRWLEIG